MIYAHYNPECTVSRDVLYTLEESYKAGIDTLFVTTTPVTSDSDREKLSGACNGNIAGGKYWLRFFMHGREG